MPSRREKTLETLHTAASDIQRAETVDRACSETVSAARSILDFEMCSLMLETDGWLEPVAVSAGSPEDGVRRMRVDEGLAGKTYRTGESFVVADVGSDAASDPAKRQYRSGISVPVGDAGVFQAVSVERDGFDETDRELAELLVAHTARTVDRLRYEERLEANKRELELQNERLERFASIVSHDLRGPLTVAMGELERARAESDDEHLAEVAWAHDRMETLIEGLLTVARTGEPVGTPEPIDLASVAGRCWNAVEWADGEIRVTAEATVLADRSGLHQLLENLFRNAAEHGGETVTLGDLSEGDGFFVADDGPGIPPSDREAALEWGNSTATNGTGFGLAIVSEIASAHGWTVAAEASAADGTRIEIRDVDLD